MEGKAASSIIVPSVQEVMKEKMISTVPPRYVRSDQDHSEIAGDSGLRTEIPIIDMSRLCSLTSMDSDSEIDNSTSLAKNGDFSSL